MYVTFMMRDAYTLASVEHMAYAFHATIAERWKCGDFVAFAITATHTNGLLNCMHNRFTMSPQRIWMMNTATLRRIIK